MLLKDHYGHLYRVDSPTSFTDLEMDFFILNAVVPGTSMDEDSADISTQSSPAGVHRSRLQLRRTIHIETRQIVDLNASSMSRVPPYNLKSDPSIEVPNYCENRPRQSQSQRWCG
ncbi:MAG: hypothetical protein Q9196_004236 [Gyalolechia fulgens]